MTTNNPTIAAPIVPKKRIIIGIFIMYGVSFIIENSVLLLFQPPAFDWKIYLGIIIPITLIIYVIIFTKYWNRSKLSIALLSLALIGKDILIMFLVPSPFSGPIMLVIGYFIVARWLNHKKHK